MENRILKFGKYKGKAIKYIILTHIGYIMWCFENLSWFKLNKEEQDLYDAIAIASKKYDINYIFPSELMYNHVFDKHKLETLETPFIFYGDIISYYEKDKNNPICKSIINYVSGKTYIHNYALLVSLQNEFNKDIDAALSQGYEYDEIFPSESELMGW